MNLVELLLERARAHPDKPAILEEGGTLSYGELVARAAGLAAHLRARGIGQGDRVLVLVPMSGQLYLTLAALWSLGAVVVFVDPGLGRPAFEHALGLARPRALIGVPKAFLLWPLSPGFRRVPLKLLATRPARGDAPGLLPLEPSAPALVTFTSGSTGKPKAAERTHGFLLAQHAALQDLLGAKGELELCTLPIVALTVLASGGTALLPHATQPPRLRPERVLRQLEAHPAEVLAATPAYLDKLVRGALARGRRLPFRRVFIGGGPVWPQVLERLREAAPQARPTLVYGSTEAEPMAHQDWAGVGEADLGHMRRGGGLVAGLPVPQVRLRVLPDRFGQPLPYACEAELLAGALPPGEPGEIVVSGGHVLEGYVGGVGDAETKWRDPATGTVWHRTGDAGYFDAQGRLWLLGRCSARAGDLYPFAVEVAAQFFPGVERAALAGCGERRVLFVEWRGTPDEAGLAGALEWAGLHEVRSVARIPLDSRLATKVDYPKLREMCRERR
ncbi:AMP-binding protein [Calidithermus chliarophilus]|uniref:AMP-binding protein n=1 Tax=Calidithermus chliarophilus TaxID=52023 RepID=UPI0003F50795|nr:AMP-binding protein [Calidithermus chliarophilus]